MVWEHHTSVHSHCLCVLASCLFVCISDALTQHGTRAALACLNPSPQCLWVLWFALGRGHAGKPEHDLQSFWKPGTFSSLKQEDNSSCCLEAQLWGRSSVICLEWSICCLVFSCEMIYEWIFKLKPQQAGHPEMGRLSSGLAVSV